MRNWDYRYTWVRDATLTLASLFAPRLSVAEADAFTGGSSAPGRTAEDLQIMYGIRGERLLPEFELAHLGGHRGSRPVRIGNGAVEQLQLDCYGQILEAAYLFSDVGGALSERTCRVPRRRWPTSSAARGASRTRGSGRSATSRGTSSTRSSTAGRRWTGVRIADAGKLRRRRRVGG